MLSSKTTHGKSGRHFDHKTVRVSAEKKTGRPMRHSRVRKPSVRIVPLSTTYDLHERADHAAALMIEMRLYQFAPYAKARLHSE